MSNDTAKHIVLSGYAEHAEKSIAVLGDGSYRIVGIISLD